MLHFIRLKLSKIISSAKFIQITKILGSACARRYTILFHKLNKNLSQRKSEKNPENNETHFFKNFGFIYNLFVLRTKKKKSELLLSHVYRYICNAVCSFNAKNSDLFFLEPTTKQKIKVCVINSAREVKLIDRDQILAMFMHTRKITFV